MSSRSISAEYKIQGAHKEILTIIKMNSKMFYYADSNKNPKGPHDLSELKEMVKSGQISLDTLVIVEGGTEWGRISDVLDEINTTEKTKTKHSNSHSFPPSPVDRASFKKYFFVAPILRLIGEGRLFSQVFAVAIRVVAVLIVISAIVAWIRGWRLISDLSEYGGAGLVIGGVVSQLVALIGVYMITHILWIRASDISLQPISEFIVIPIFSIFLRMLGELYACLLAVLGVGGCLLILLAGRDGGAVINQLTSILPGSELLPGFLHGGTGDGTFLAGMIFLVSCLVAGFVALLFFYLLAEIVVVWVDIARNIRAIRNNQATLLPPIKEAK